MGDGIYANRAIGGDCCYLAAYGDAIAGNVGDKE